MRNRTSPTLVPAVTDSRTTSNASPSLCPESGGAVLLVAIQREYRERLKAALVPHGVIAVGTSSEVHALELVSRGRLFDAILVDASNTRTLDLNLLGQLHQHCPNLPIVLSLPDDESALQGDAHDSGVFRCVRRTNPPDEVSSSICEAVAISRHARRG